MLAYRSNYRWRSNLHSLLDNSRLVWDACMRGEGRWEEEAYSYWGLGRGDLSIDAHTARLLCDFMSAHDWSQPMLWDERS